MKAGCYADARGLLVAVGEQLHGGHAWIEALDERGQYLLLAPELFASMKPRTLTSERAQDVAIVAQRVHAARERLKLSGPGARDNALGAITAIEALYLELAGLLLAQARIRGAA